MENLRDETLFVFWKLALKKEMKEKNVCLGGRGLLKVLNPVEQRNLYLPQRQFPLIAYSNKSSHLFPYRCENVR